MTWRRLRSAEEIWTAALDDEAAFWDRWIATRGNGARLDFDGRMHPESPIMDPYLLDAIAAIPRDPVRVLDVGAGPISTVGLRNYRSPGRAIELVAVDPLADRYLELLARAGLTPPVATQACRGEDVAAHFGRGAFDVAYSRNALDHAADPMAAIRAMVEVVRADGRVVLVHGRREAEARGYEELHQWNFDVRGDRLELFGRRASFDVGAALGSGVAIGTDTFTVPGGGDWVVATISREPVPSSSHRGRAE
jgi:SAM-dependent methyltransferase